MTVRESLREFIRASFLVDEPLTFELLRREVDVRAFAHPALRYVTQAGARMPPRPRRGSAPRSRRRACS